MKAASGALLALLAYTPEHNSRAEQERGCRARKSLQLAATHAIDQEFVPGRLAPL